MPTTTINVPIPPLTLSPGMQLRVEVIDPHQGLPVTGVVVSEWAIYGDDTTGTADDTDTPTPGPFMVVPGPGSALG